MELLRFEHKKIRAKVIEKYLKDLNINDVICFSCGNASRELKNTSLNVLDISPTGDLIANRWFTKKEIKKYFPNYFDATSGHLENDLMILIGQEYKKHLGTLDKLTYVPSGSGETLVCLKLAYPDNDFIAVYNIDKATEYSKDCELNKLVEVMAKKIIL